MIPNTSVRRSDLFTSRRNTLFTSSEYASTPFTEIYDVIPDKYGDVWTGGRTSDRIYRLDPKTGRMAAYLLPNKTNIRRVDVDSSTNPPVFWVGDDHSPTIYRLEPLDKSFEF